MKIEKLCLFCKSFYFESAEHNYSEWTPGCDVSIGCYKGYFEVDIFKDTTKSYRKKLLTAQGCVSFVPVDEVAQKAEWIKEGSQ